ncbi:hypothetical protein LR69_01486 [Geobacillus sp. BCO2]|nr:hypothetical protein LR69_01486 [Geobacillus sp. BCO2]
MDVSCSFWPFAFDQVPVSEPVFILNRPPSPILVFAPLQTVWLQI